MYIHGVYSTSICIHMVCTVLVYVYTGVYSTSICIYIVCTVRVYVYTGVYSTSICIYMVCRYEIFNMLQIILNLPVTLFFIEIFEN